MSKTERYTGIGWQNSPSTATPLSAANLQTVDNAIIDNEGRIMDLEANTDNLQAILQSITTLQTLNISATNQLSSSDWQEIRNKKIVWFYGWAYGFTDTPLMVPFYPCVFNEVVSGLSESCPFIVPAYVKSQTQYDGGDPDLYAIYDFGICFFLQNNTLHWYKQTPKGCATITSGNNQFQVIKILY